MGWPKDKGLRLYFERKAKSYLIVDHSLCNGCGNYDYIGELMIDNDPESPKLCTGSASLLYLYRSCRRASWSEMPEVWQRGLAEWIDGEPEAHRGLWRIEEVGKKPRTRRAR